MNTSPQISVYRARFSLMTLLIVAMAGMSACSPSSIESDQAAYVQPVETLVVTRHPELDIEREYAGLVLPRQSTEIGFERSGELIELKVNDGESVRRGDVLAILNTELLESEQAELEAGIEDISAQRDLNTSELKRFNELESKGFAAQQEIDRLNSQRLSLDAREKEIEARLQANRERLRQSRLIAPFDGIIDQRHVDLGSVVTAGAPVVTVLEDAILEARVGVPVRMLEKLHAGDSVRLTAAGREIEGQIIALGNSVTRNTLTVPARISIADTTGVVPGDQVYMRLTEAVDRSGFWVPMAAVTDGIRGLWSVYVVAGEPGSEIAEMRDVRILYAAHDQAFVEGALADGERLIPSGLTRLVPGQRVQPIVDKPVANTPS